VKTKSLQLFCAVLVIAGAGDVFSQTNTGSAVSSILEIRTPPAPHAPRINGPDVFGVRPENPFIYQVPVTGDRPMHFTAEDLPEGLVLNPDIGVITGTIAKKWLKSQYTVTLHAKNVLGEAEKKFTIVVGDTIALTPPLGWNSWNCWGTNIDAVKVKKAAEAMIRSGLIYHGWSYINIDDTWQGRRGGAYAAILPNEKFTDIKLLCDNVHALGLKIGIYSTPWITSYAGYTGGSADNTNGIWPPPELEGTTNRPPRRTGKYSFAENDARQWAEWGIDYLKYDWNPKSDQESDELFHWNTAAMGDALKKSKRDILYSYSNSMPFENAADQAEMLNCWRTTGDVQDTWWSITGIGFSQDRWAPYSRPGHWNDPDMLVVGYVDVGKGKNLHPTRLTPDEQYTHITLWSLLAAPLLIGCDMDRLDEFTLNLLSNDEVLAVDQDPLGKQARLVSQYGPEVTLVNIRPGRTNQVRTLTSFQVWSRPLRDGSHAVGLFNLADTNATVTVKWSDLRISGNRAVRDIWRQKDLGSFKNQFSVSIAPHGAEMIKVR